MSNVEWMMKVAQTELKEWRLAKALKMMQDGRWTIHRGASFAGLKYHEMLDRMSKSDVDSGPTLKELRESLDLLARDDRETLAAVRKKIRKLKVSREDVTREVRAGRRERAKRSR